MREFDINNYPPRQFSHSSWHDQHNELERQTELCIHGIHLPVIKHDIHEFPSMLHGMTFRMVGQESITCSHCEAYLDRAYTCHMGLHAYRRIEHPMQWISIGGSAYPIRFPDKHVCEFCGDTKYD